MAALQETVAVPEVVTLVGLIPPQASPLGTVSVRPTAPLNPLIAIALIVEVSEAPTGAVAGVDADTLKSVTVIVAVVECNRLPLVPDTDRT